MPSSLTLTRDRAHRIADSKTRIATVLSRRDRATYQLEDVITKQEFWASSDGVSFSPGTRVKVERHTIATGSNWAIISRAPEEQRGVATNARIARADHTSVFVGSVTPQPLRLPIGFPTPREMRIRGFSLSAGPTSYGDAGITDDSAPVVTSSLITAQLVASGAVVPGNYNMTVHGKTFAEAIQCFSVPEQIFILGAVYQDLGGGDDCDIPTILVVETAGWTTARVLQGTAEALTYRDCTSGAARVGEDIYSIVVDYGGSGAGNAPRIISTSADPDAPLSITGDIAGITFPYNGGRIAWNGSKIALVSVAPDAGLVSVNPDGTGATVIAALGANFRGAYWDGTYYWVFDYSGSGVSRVTTGGVVTAVVGAAGLAAVHSGAFVYTSDYGGGNIRKIDAATATLAASLSTGTGVPYDLVVVGGYLYCTLYSAGSIIKIDLSTFTVAATLPISGGAFLQEMAVSRDESTLYAVKPTNPVTIHEIDLATFTLTASHEVGSEFGNNFWGGGLLTY